MLRNFTRFLNLRYVEYSIYTEFKVRAIGHALLYVLRFILIPENYIFVYCIYI